MAANYDSSYQNDGFDFWTPPLRESPARRVRDDTEALGVADKVAAHISKNAIVRDRERILPHDEMELLSDQGLLAITVPKEYGGPGVRTSTVVRVIATLSAADSSIGQLPQNHFFVLEALRLQGSEEQKRFFYDRVLRGERIGNAFSEKETKTALDHVTKLRRRGANFRLDGSKFYSTGVLFAHWVATVAIDEDGRSILALLPKETSGITIVDDWSGFGQRVTGSGTTLFEDVSVHPFSILHLGAAFEKPTSMGPFAQIMHAAVELGIAEAALLEVVRFVRDHARPWRDSGVERTSDEPYVIAAIGELTVLVEAADALLERAAELTDQAATEPSVRTVAAASIAVAEAKIATTDAALLASSKLIELTGARGTLAAHGLDRYWRNARTHTVHDPVRWKYHAVGNYWLNGVIPPRHGAI